MKNNELRVGAAIVFKDHRGRRYFLVVKHKTENGWEIPKATARKAESSVRASIRMMAELAGMNAKVLEEAGRASGTAIINGRSVSQKLYYYLMNQISAGEVLGFVDYDWLEYAKAQKALSLKREKEMLRNAKEVLRVWEKTKGKNQPLI